MRSKATRKQVTDPSLGRCVLLGPPRINYLIALFGVFGLALFVANVLDPTRWHATAGQLLLIGPGSIGMIAFPFVQARTKRLWIGEHGFRFETFRKPALQAFWRDTGPAELVIKSLVMPIRQNGVWGSWVGSDFEVRNRDLRELINGARLRAVGSEPIPGAPWLESDWRPQSVGAPTGRKTVRDFEVDGDIVPVVEAWATDNNFTAAGNDFDGTHIYVRDPLSYPNAATRPGSRISTLRFVSIRQTGREVHLEAWWTRNSFFRLMTLGCVPLESPVEAGGWLGRLFTSGAWKPVDELLRLLGQPPLASRPLQLPQGTKPAGIRRRSAAIVIDFFIYLVLSGALLSWAVSLRGVQTTPASTEYFAAAWVWLLVSGLYVPVIWRLLGGLPGQRLLGMRIVSGLDGRRLSGLACLGRYLVWLACVVTLVPAVVTAVLALKDPYRQTWPDRAVDSVVVRRAGQGSTT